MYSWFWFITANLFFWEMFQQLHLFFCFLSILLQILEDIFLSQMDITDTNHLLRNIELTVNTFGAHWWEQTSF